MMLFPNQADKQRRSEIVRALQAEEADRAVAGERLLAVDPDSGDGYLLLGTARADAGALDEAESLFWKGLDIEPTSYNFYFAVTNVRKRRDPQDALAQRLMLLSVSKIALLEEIPDTVVETFSGPPGIDYFNPASY